MPHGVRSLEVRTRYPIPALCCIHAGRSLEEGLGVHHAELAHGGSLFPDGFLVEVFVAGGRNGQRSAAQSLSQVHVPSWAWPGPLASHPDPAPPTSSQALLQLTPASDQIWPIHGQKRPRVCRHWCWLARVVACEGSWCWAGLSTQQPLVDLVHLRLAVLSWARVAGLPVGASATGTVVSEAGAGRPGKKLRKNPSVQGGAGSVQGSRVPSWTRP